MQINEYYSTSDLSLAAAISLTIPVEAVNRINPNKVQFLFKKSEELNKIIDGYWRDLLKVSPSVYFNQLKTLKARIYSEGTE